MFVPNGSESGGKSVTTGGERGSMNKSERERFILGGVYIPPRKYAERCGKYRRIKMYCFI